MQATKIPLFAVYFLLAGCASTAIDHAIINAWNGNDSIPLAHVIDETLTIERAYRVQTRIVQSALRTQRPAGFKAGLTSHAAQARFRTKAPVAGVLINESADTPHPLQLSKLRGLHLETEVALRVGIPIRARLKSTEDLRAHIDGIAAALELPNLDYEHPDQLEAVDIVASNVAATYFLLGEFAPPQRRDANRVPTSLECEGERLSSGKGRDAMGDQWTAALWLVNTTIDQGWTIEPGQVLLTGALGQAVRAQPGQCVADFGDWGRIEVEIVR
jgi:2-keto-4-pentenoate hydratase